MKKQNNIAARKDLIKHTWFAIKLFLFFASALVVSIVATFIFVSAGIILQAILTLLIIVLGITFGVTFSNMIICVAILLREDEV